MKLVNKSFLFAGVGMVTGIVIGIGAYSLFGGQKSDTTGGAGEPLYWVAPMDPNYRRDQPGKSPMGMDLIPVYEEAGADNPGLVTISPQVENNIGVRTAPVASQAWQSHIDTVGYVQYDEDKLIHIHPRVAGWVEVLNVKAAGDPVAKGQPLYQLYSPELVNAQEELVSALQSGNQRLIQAAEDRLRALQIASETIATLRKSRQVQQTITAYSPQDGVIDHLLVREGFFVKPDTTMMSIGNLEEVWVQAEIFAQQAALVTQGAPVTMTLDYLPGREWQGEVDYVYPTLDAKTRTVKVRMRFANPNRELKPNMFAQISIHSKDTEPTLIVPRSALIRTATNERAVLALGDGRFKSVAVKSGRVTESQVEILRGLREGDKVVVSAQFLLDSESSINSDLMRMQHDDDMDATQNDAPMDESASANTVRVQATVNDVMADQRMVNLTHEPIPEWQWPVMTMSFGVDENVDLSTLKPGMTLNVAIEKTGDGQYNVVSVQESQP